MERARWFLFKSHGKPPLKVLCPVFRPSDRRIGSSLIRKYGISMAIISNCSFSTIKQEKLTTSLDGSQKQKAKSRLQPPIL